MGGQITVFSIDTSVLQSAGYRLDFGALKVLREQLPDWMRLVIPEVIVREVVDHRMHAVRTAHREADSALHQLERSTGISLDRLRTQLAQYRLFDKSSDAFKKEIALYVSRFGGDVVELKSLNIITEMFDRYFELEPPFGGTKKSKSEFPDAAALISLEQYAEEKRTKAVVVSADAGWQAFAAKSATLYCVNSLEDFTALYAAGSETARSAVEGATRAIVSPKSKIHKKVSSQVVALFNRVPWTVKATGGASAILRARVVDVSVGPIAGAARRSWVAAHDQDLFVIEAVLRVNADVTVEATVPNAGNLPEQQRRLLTRSFEVRAFLTVTALDGQSDNWDADIQIVEPAFTINAGEFQA